MPLEPFFKVVGKGDAFHVEIGVRNDDNTLYVQNIGEMVIRNKFKGLTQAQIDAFAAFDIQNVLDAIDNGDVGVELP